MAEEKYDEKRGLYYDHSMIYKKEPDPFDEYDHSTISKKEPDPLVERARLAENQIQCGSERIQEKT